MSTRKTLLQFVVLVLFVAATTIAIWLGSLLLRTGKQVKTYKQDLYSANQIRDGFLNGGQWSWQVERIIESKVDSFQLTPKNKELLKERISKVMYSLIDQVDRKIHEKQDDLKDKVKMGAIRMFVDLDKVRADVPEYANTVVKEIDNSSRRKDVKGLLKQKIEDLLTSKDSLKVSLRDLTLKKYKMDNMGAFNRFIRMKTSAIEGKQRTWSYGLISIMVFVLALWLVLLKLHLRSAYALAFLFSVVVSFVMLYIGVNLPMLEIDARISEMDLQILSGHVTFYNQILFYQSKSIWSVAHLLITNGKIDSIFVGSLIILFSIGFPSVKLLSAAYWLFKKEKKEKGFIHFMAFKSGKWSMADVMVVAIFIAFIGFQSILKDQLDNIAARGSDLEMMNLLTTNRSQLQIGFVVFVSFVLFNLFLAVILGRITKFEGPTSGARMFRDTYQALKIHRSEKKARRSGLSGSHSTASVKADEGRAHSAEKPVDEISKKETEKPAVKSPKPPKIPVQSNEKGRAQKVDETKKPVRTAHKKEVPKPAEKSPKPGGTDKTGPTKRGRAGK